MANKEDLLQRVAQQVGPQRLQQMVQQVEQELMNDPDVTPDSLMELERQLEFVLDNPQSYKEVVARAIQAGMIDPNDVPPEFDPVFISVMLLAVKELAGRARGGQGFARGGLAQAARQLQSQGRGGDTILAHINPREAEVLRRMGGAGTINPNTGLREFKGGIFKSVGKIFKSVAKAALPILAGSIMGPVGGALVGAGMGAMNGGGLKGAVLGGLGGYLNAPGNALGGASGLANTIGTKAASVLSGLGDVGTSLANSIGTQALGSGLIGMATGALSGQNPLISGLTAGGTAYLAPTIAGLGKGTGLESYANSAANAAASGAMLGQNPLTAGAGGALAQLGGNLLSGAGLAPVNTNGVPTNPTISGEKTVFGGSPSQLPTAGVSPNSIVTDNTYPYATEALANTGSKYSGLGGMQAGSAYGQTDLGSLATPAPNFNVSGGTSAGNYGFTADVPSSTIWNSATQGGWTGNGTAGAAGTGGAGGAGGAGGTGGGLFGNLNMSNLLMGAGLLGALSGATPKQAQDAINQSSMTPEQKAALSRSLENYTAKWNMTVLPNQGTPEYTQMMNDIYNGVGLKFMDPTITNQVTTVPATGMKRGGALNRVAMMARGAGDGRSDTINAKLSDGEYVMDAETVSLLGNGSTKAGAAALDQMREQIRRQKGKNLVKGKFSADAKSPLAYMKGGLR